MMMAQSLFQILRHQNPDCELHVLAPKWSEALLSRMPQVNKSIVLPFKHGELQLKKRYQLAKKLVKENYSQAIVLPNSFKSALIPFWANIPKRTGWLGEYRFGLLNDIRFLNKKKFPLMVQRFAALGSSQCSVPRAGASDLPIPTLNITSENIQLALAKHQLQISAKPILALCPGAEFGPSKCWPAKYYATVANQKLNEGWNVWIFGSPNDVSIAVEIQTLTHERCINLTGKTTLAEAVDLLSLAKTVITNDSGLMHIAAAVGCEVIALYGSTSPVFTPPLTPKAHVLQKNLSCQPCFKRQCPLKHHQCMELLLPEEVINQC